MSGERGEREGGAARVTEWGAVLDVLHALANMITVRSHYTEGHPAIAQADEHASAGFVRVLERMTDLVVALVDGEFIVSERPLPDLRARLHVLADAMTRHEIECIVFQRGMTREECHLLGRALAQQGGASGRVREETQAGLVHVLLRFVVRAGDTKAGAGAHTSFFVPAVGEMLVSAARALASDAPIDKLGILAVANQMVVACAATGPTIQQRAWTRTIEDEATHASNVAMLTAAMARDAGYPQRVVIDATAAAILHDIGHLFLPDEIRGTPEPLLDERAKPVFRNHTFAGAQMLLGAGCAPLWIAAAFEHHRGIDAGGYPALESKEPPHELVRIIALANYFDSKRTIVGGRADDPETALRGAMELEERYFGAGLIRRFLRVLGVFPAGTTVELSSLEPAVVTRANAVDPWRPQVKILRGPNAGKFAELRETDSLQMRHRLSIVRAIAPPLFVLADVVDEAPVVAPVVAASAEVLVPEAKPLQHVGEAARGAAERARGQLGGMDDLLDALLTVPTEALVSAMPPAPSTFPRGAAVSIPPYVVVPNVSSRPPPVVTRPPPLTITSAPPPAARSIAPVPSARPPEGSPEELAELERVLLARLGPITAVPVLIVKDVTKVKLDHRAAFVLRFLDGMSTIDDILDASGLPRVEALRILEDLRAASVIRIS
ncbi:MAG: phosphodiesterase [Labilithrix sp.]|nr:phosphodiesterase [Labilithrix sp.]